MSPDNFRISSNRDGEMRLMCPACNTPVPIKYNNTKLRDLQTFARKHILRHHPHAPLDVEEDTP